MVNRMPELDLKGQAQRMGLQIGKNIKVVRTKRAQGLSLIHI